MEIIINECEECPLLSWVDLYLEYNPFCSIRQMESFEKYKFSLSELDEIDLDDDNKPITPEWCPLEIETEIKIKWK